MLHGAMSDQCPQGHHDGDGVAAMHEMQFWYVCRSAFQTSNATKAPASHAAGFSVQKKYKQYS
jgi:hypothetical protein